MSDQLRWVTILDKLHGQTLKVSDWANVFCQIIVWPAFFLVISTFLLQILFRYFLNYPLEWYLEFIRICYAWALFLAFPVAFKTKEHILFEAAFNRFNVRLKRIFVFMAHLLSLAFFIFLIAYGIKLFEFNKFFTLTSIPISRRWKVLCVAVSGIMLTIHILPMLINDVISFSKKSNAGLSYYGGEAS
jgi:TRAP-type C4-dicarboxylate transport system permease small subunit